MHNLVLIFISTRLIFFCQGFLGLSGAILIQVYQTILRGNPTSFILMIALLPSITPLLLMCLVTITPANTADEKKHLNGLSTVAVTVAVYLMILIIFENIFSLPLWARVVTFLVLLLLLGYPLKIAISARRDEVQCSSQTLSIETYPLMDERESLQSCKFSATPCALFVV